MFQHISVLLNESIEMLDVTPGKIYVDMTLGGAGHSSKILQKLQKSGFLYCFDKDENAIQVSQKRLQEIASNYEIIHSDFVHLREELQKRNVNGVDGILFDLGVSSPQFDTPERGFSYQYDARLDMRMDQTQVLDAYTIINQYAKEKLMQIFYEYGEEPFARKIAENIVKERKISPIETTLQLVDIIKKSLPNARKNQKGHPAKQVFQALRIEVNNELGGLKSALYQALEMLNPNGRIAVITFHSLEDRIVKQIFREMSTQQNSVKNLVDLTQLPPAYQCLNKKPLVASDEEMQNNHRAHSAKLRGIMKL